MKREVATLRGREFPWSMSDIKPGERRVYLSWIYYALLSVRQSLRRLYELILLAVYDTPEAVQNFEASLKRLEQNQKGGKHNGTEQNQSTSQELRFYHH